MAPKLQGDKKRNGRGKAKDLSNLSAREREWESWRTVHPFYPPGEDKTGVGKLANAVASKRNEHGPTFLQAAAVPKSLLTDHDVRVFVCFLTAGLVPPMSAFLVAVLAKYGLLLAHLHPNAVLLLAIFQYMCEAFVGIHPSVALFRHYFYPRVEGNALSGSVTFRLRDGMSLHFIGLEKKKWEEWRHRWCFVRFSEPNESLTEPTAHVSRIDHGDWSVVDGRDEDLQPAYDRIKELHDLGLTGRQVVTHFLSRSVAPLQNRSHPMWLYQGVNDTTRLFTGEQSSLSKESLDLMVNELCGGSDGHAPLAARVRPLSDDLENIDAIIAKMPLCNEFGISPEWVPPEAYTLGGDEVPAAPTAGSSYTDNPSRSSVLVRKNWTLSLGPSNVPAPKPIDKRARDDASAPEPASKRPREVPAAPTAQGALPASTTSPSAPPPPEPIKIEPVSSDEERPSGERRQLPGPTTDQPLASSSDPASASTTMPSAGAPSAGAPPAGTPSTEAPPTATPTVETTPTPTPTVEQLLTTLLITAPESSSATNSGDFPRLTVDPGCFGVARKAIDTLEQQHRYFADTAAKAYDAYKSSWASLERQREEAAAAAETQAAAKAKLQQALVSVLVSAKKEATVEALREAHEAQLAKLEEERAKLEDEHLVVLANAEERIQQQSEMISDYSEKMKALREDLEKAVAREQALTRDFAEHEGELAKQAQEREDALKRQLHDSETKLAKAEDDAVSTMMELNEVNLARKREAGGLLTVAHKAIEVMRALDMPPSTPADSDIPCLTRFFANMVGALEDELPLKVAHQLQQEGADIAGAVASTILPRVSYLAPDFPFDHLFDHFEDDDRRRAAEAAVAAYVEDVKQRTTRG